MSWHDEDPVVSPTLRTLDDRDRLGLFDPLPASKRDHMVCVRDMFWPSWGSDHQIESARAEASSRRMAVARSLFTQVEHGSLGSTPREL